MSNQEFILKRLDSFIGALNEGSTAFKLASEFCPDPWSETLKMIHRRFLSLYVEAKGIKELVEQSGLPQESSDRLDDQRG